MTTPSEPTGTLFDEKRCPHGVRLPHECRDCFNEIPKPLAAPSGSPFVEVRVALWQRLCGKADKVTKHATLTAAIAFVEGLESGLTQEVVNGELTFLDGDDILATVYVRVENGQMRDG